MRRPLTLAGLVVLQLFTVACESSFTFRGERSQGNPEYVQNQFNLRTNGHLTMFSDARKRSKRQNEEYFFRRSGILSGYYRNSDKSTDQYRRYHEIAKKTRTEDFAKYNGLLFETVRGSNKPLETFRKNTVPDVDAQFPEFEELHALASDLQRKIDSERSASMAAAKERQAILDRDRDQRNSRAAEAAYEAFNNVIRASVEEKEARRRSGRSAGESGQWATCHGCAGSGRLFNTSCGVCGGAGRVWQ